MKLNKEQQQAVETEAQDILVVAGAGSGKTSVLTSRMEYLINKGVSPHEIVTITYTKLAAGELKERLSHVPGIGDAFVGTIHAFANKVIRNNAEELGIRNFRVLDSQLEAELIKELILVNRLKHLTLVRYLHFKEKEDAFNRLLIGEKELDEFLTVGERFELNSITGEQCGTQDSQRYTTVQDLMKSRNIIDFSDMLKYAIRYFDKSEHKLSYLLVDEFQDIGPLDYQFLTALDPKNTFYVGDDYQAIYGFKGASVGIFLNAIEDETVTKVYLKQNYRNTDKIIKLGETIIQQTKDYAPKETLCNNEGDNDIRVLTRERHSEGVFRELRNTDNRSTAILCRTNKEIMKISEQLLTYGIAYIPIRKGIISDGEELAKLISAPSVKIMTVHQSKGLEFDNVILYGKFPLVTTRWNKNDEERRIMYVGVTRARHNLTILN